MELQNESSPMPEARPAIDRAPAGATNRRGVLADEEFVPFLMSAFSSFTAIEEKLPHLDRGPREARFAFGRIHDVAADFVAFLDDHGARANETYASMAELGAGVRGFASAGLELSKLQRWLRLSDSGVSFDTSLVADALSDLEETQVFIRNALIGLYQEACSEGRRLLGSLPDCAFSGPPEVHARKSLASTLGAVTLPQQEATARRLAAQLLATKKVLDRFSTNEGFADANAMRSYAQEVCDEQQISFFETRVHNILSRYDTYLQGTNFEYEQPGLLSFRAHVVALVHVCRFMRELSHFYERHENDIRCEQTKNRIAELVDKDDILDRVLRFGLATLHRLLDHLVPLADELLTELTQEREVVLEIPQGLSLHARPVSRLTKIVAHHGTPVTLKVGGAECYAGSMLEVLMTLGDAGSITEVGFRGDDAPLRDIQALFEAGLGETGGVLPAELSYLRS